MVEALLAAEDKHYFEHHGVSPLGILRATFVNIKSLHMREGGSTITQQLAKNLFLDVKRTAVIKLAETVAAYKIEERFSKEEIMSLYLTEIYFGSGARGIEQASRVYFGKTTSQLDLQEAAFLAGIIRSPSFLGSPKHRAEAIERQRQVLRAMQECNFISLEEEMKAEATPTVFRHVEIAHKSKPFLKFPYFTSYVLELVRNGFDEHAIGINGLKIFTTLDPVAQNIAEKLLASEIESPLGIDEEALVALSVKDNAIRAPGGWCSHYWGQSMELRHKVPIQQGLVLSLLFI